MGLPDSESIGATKEIEKITRSLSLSTLHLSLFPDVFRVRDNIIISEGTGFYN